MSSSKRILLRFCGGISYFIVALFLITIGFSQDPKEGEKLFKANCTACHAIDKKVIGPALKGVHERWNNQEEELIAFIHNSQAYMQAGRPMSDYALKLFEEHNKTVMTAFENLSDDQIRSILAYIKEEGSKVPQGVAQVEGGQGQVAGESATSVPTTRIYRFLLFLKTLLVVTVLFLVVVIVVLIAALQAKSKGVPFDMNLFWSRVIGVLKHPYVLTLIGVVVFSWLMVVTVKEARSVGVHQGYQPVQPIAFSHKLHAGQYKISCEYCHVGVERGKMATIPSANICMNCHKYITSGPKYGEKEIGKVIKAYEEGKPIEWVRIHNLPDFVYFSHAQHVKVGLDGAKDPETLRQTCATCHGPVWEMEEVYQYSPLTMGWCIDCHRKTPVDVTKSDYYRVIYDEYVGKEQVVTVETLGGLECARCHY